MKNHNLVMVVVGMLLLISVAGCSSTQKKVVGSAPDLLSLGREKCISAGGQIITECYPDKSSEKFCLTKEINVFDDGTQEINHRCLLENFSAGTCDAAADQDKAEMPSKLPEKGTVSDLFHSAVLDIMTKVKNTGYAHNKKGNFSLVPDYTELGKPQTEYNLFLDCSGFVGYYVIQGLASQLYGVASPSQYACQERPLAADFADIIKQAPEINAGHHAATQADIAGNNVCWGQVKQMKDILPGDVIVYKHPDNIDSSKKECKDKRKVYKVTGNTGHILFVHDVPFESNRCKDNEFSCGLKQTLLPGKWQWVVKVADSTTVPHMDDSRKAGVNSSDYEGHFYHAWEKGVTDGCVIERCDNGEYHRSCLANGSKAVEYVNIDTTHPTNPTGIGVGKMYIGADFKSYRTNYTADRYEYEKDGDKEQIVFIGRPIKCK